MHLLVFEWTYTLDESIWITYYNFACHLQVGVDQNKESCILAHISWRFQLLTGVLLISLLQQCLYSFRNQWDYEEIPCEGLNWRLCITHSLPASLCDWSRMVTLFPVDRIITCVHLLKESGKHTEWIWYGLCVWNLIERLHHREVVARFWQILTWIGLYCTVSTSLFVALDSWFQVIQYKHILNSNGSYLTYDFQHSHMVFSQLRIQKLPGC